MWELGCVVWDNLLWLLFGVVVVLYDCVVVWNLLI